MTSSCTGAPPCPVSGKGHGVPRIGKLRNDVGIAMSSPVARTVDRVARTICSVAKGTGIAGMGAMFSGNVREYRTAWPPAGGRGTVARAATITRSKFGMACPAIWRRASRNGIHTYGAAIRVANADDATGEGSRPGCRCVDRAGIRECMRNTARNVDHAVHVLRGIVKARVTRVDVSVAVLADRARREAGMDGVRRREAVAGAASGRCQVIRVAPYRRLVRAAGKCGAMTVSVGALQGRFIIDGTYTASLSERAELDGPRLYTRRMVLGPCEMV
jgi:hypothetical protein